ncbi:MAG TPA: aldolase/citrate lyase family protein [Gammaproteobacteria bacterium]
MKEFLKLAADNPAGLVGTWVKIPALLTIEALGHAGFDYVVIDMEHAPHSLEQAYTFIFAAQATGMAALVRLPDHTGSTIQRLLDAGADGLLVPRVTTVEAAERITRRMVFSPAGERGLGATSRAGRWGLADVADYVARGNDQCLRMVQLEDWSSLRSADEFLAVASVNGVFVGLGDLSLSSGKRSSDPDVQRLVRAVAESAARFGKLSGIAAATPDEAQSYLRMGYSLVMVSNDATMFAKAAANTLASTRPGTRPATPNRQS